MKEIKLSQGNPGRKCNVGRSRVAWVDDEDYEWLVQWQWSARRHKRRWYATRRTSRAGGRKSFTVQMHREIMRAPRGTDVHHRNGNGLDNRKQNLRVCSRAENMQGYARKRQNASSRYRGVHFFKRDQTWQAYIQVNGRFSHLGYFDSEEEAARARDEVAKALIGAEAHLNFPE